MCVPDLISTTSKILALSRSGLLLAARTLFDEMTDRDTIAWNAMLTAYSHSPHPHQSLSLFSSMRLSGPAPDSFSLTAALSASSDLHDLAAGRKLHALALRFGFYTSLPVANSLVDMYGKCSCHSDAARVFDEMARRNEVSWCSLLYTFVNSGLVDEARLLFDEMPVRSTVAWNIMIMGYTRDGEPELSMGLLKKMIQFGFEGDILTISSLMSACMEIGDPCFGRMCHAFVIRSGWNDAIEINNSVLSFYAKFGCLDDALKIFEHMGTKSQVSWNAMVDAHMKVGDVKGGISLFNRAPETNIVSWTSMIAGFARNGYAEEALAAFVYMMRNCFRPDDFTFGAVLHACTILAILVNGMTTHSCVIQCGFDSFVYVANGLVNMYAKCGDIESSSRVFESISKKDLVSWNAIIFGYALHGWALKTIEVYKQMVASNVLPDKVTFIGLMMACSHGGLIEQGKGFFETMELVHGVVPDVDHVTCILDMLGRAGHLREASELLVDSSNLCEALLGACSIRGDMKTGRKLGHELMRMEPENEVGYVMLSNLYCVSGQWREAEKVRRAMSEQGVKKEPGCSWIEVRDSVMVFVSGNRSLAGIVGVHKMLHLLESDMRIP